MGGKIIPIIVASMFLISCEFHETREARLAHEQNEEYAKKCGCLSVDDCLGKYKFAEARKFISILNENLQQGGDEAMQKAVTSEAFYWVKNKEYEKAINVIDETADVALAQYYSSEKKNEIRFNVLNRIIEKIIDEGDFKEAKKWIVKIDDVKEQKKLLKKIENAEKVLK